MLWPLQRCPVRHWQWQGIRPRIQGKKVAEFIVEKLYITSLPAAIRRKKEKGKNTFADYGFTAQRVDEKEAIIQALGGTRKLAIKLLYQRRSGIYACVTESGQSTGEVKTQIVILAEKE